jgi:hypothetical protein
MAVVISGFTVVLADRVKETTQTVGTGTYALDGASAGFRSFVAGIGSGNRCPYVVVAGAGWEIGIGLVTSGAPATITRDLMLASSNNNLAINWPIGVKDIWCDAPSALLAQVGPQEIPTSTRVFFGQSAAPTGWTQITTQNDRVLRLVSGAGAGTGGSWTISGLTVLGHSLTPSELAAHSHLIAANADVGNSAPISGVNFAGYAGGTPGTDRYVLRSSGITANVGLTNTVGQGDAHIHGISADGNWRMAYLDVILCGKN